MPQKCCFIYPGGDQQTVFAILYEKQWLYLFYLQMDFKLKKKLSNRRD